MKYWNPENMMYINTDEYKYLNEIALVIKQSKYITETLMKIKDNERFNIQKKSVKDMVDFTEIKSKLAELNNMINEL